MSLRLDFLAALAALALASFACRAGGFWLMRFVTLTPRLRAALDAAPLSVMIGLVVPACVKGGPAEWLALGAVILTRRASGNDVLATGAGVLVVALIRATGAP